MSKAFVLNPVNLSTKVPETADSDLAGMFVSKDFAVKGSFENIDFADPEDIASIIIDLTDTFAYLAWAASLAGAAVVPTTVTTTVSGSKVTIKFIGSTSGS